MRKVSPQKFAESLYEALLGKDKEQAEKAFKNFILVLKKYKSLKNSDKIIKIFSRLYDEKNRVVEMELETAKPLTPADRQKIVRHFEKELGQKVSAREIVDPSLLGGLRVRYGDTVIDGSLRGKLNLLRNKIG